LCLIKEIKERDVFMIKNLFKNLLAIVGKIVWCAVVCAGKLIEIAFRCVVIPVLAVCVGLCVAGVVIFAMVVLLVAAVTNPIGWLALLVGIGACYGFWSSWQHDTLIKPHLVAAYRACVAWFTDEWPDPEVDDDKEVVVATETAPREWKNHESFESVKDSFQKC